MRKTTKAGPPTSDELIDLLRRVGQALYGDEWISPLARDLGNHYKTVSRWNAGDNEIPETARARIAAELLALVRDRGPDVSAELKRRLAEIKALSR